MTKSDICEVLQFSKDQGFLYAMRVVEMKFGLDSLAYQALLYRWAGDHTDEDRK